MFVSNLIAELESIRSGCYHMFPLIAKTYGNSTESQGTTIYGYDFLAENIDVSDGLVDGASGIARHVYTGGDRCSKPLRHLWWIPTRS